ncbi:Crp/Fnr family transcriptional regulator [Nocardioides sp. URHA0032]|uniref:Crp/Fnr family transcriptional regulator n=1 Tax=Nocardioides sp. URHA0032 TaxID=1380388 RepID=UPI00068625B8|nr:Crp/Fnr family transcriptional regulator [Nocardioides sp. URHA0032]
MEWSLLASLDEDERRRVLSAARRRSYGRGDVLVHEGDPSDSLHLVSSGRLAVRVSTSDGENATLNLLGPGDYFGELSLLEGSPPVRSATIVALEDAETLSLSAAEFRDLRRRHPAANQLLLFLMARRVEELSARLLEAMYDGLDRRVHRRLAELAGMYGDGRPGPVVVPLTQEHLAELVGGTRPSVNQVLQRLVAQGVVELGRGRVVVLDRGWLEDRSG